MGFWSVNGNYLERFGLGEKGEEPPHLKNGKGATVGEGARAI